MDRSILKGIYDLHVHAGPSAAPRIVDAAEMLKEAEDAGYAGFVVKDHYVPAVFGTKMVEKHLGNGTTKAYGCLVLNNSVGGINIHAVAAAYQLGVAMVLFPTVSSSLHIEATKGKGFFGTGAQDIEEQPINVLDDQGELPVEVVEVLDFMAKKDMVLSTGHLRPREIDAVVNKAIELGLKRILITHPHYQVNATLDDMKAWADKGAYIELTACVFRGIGAELTECMDISYAKKMIDAVGAARMIIDSDLGQKKNVKPVEGMYNFLTLLHNDFGVTEEEINTMTKENPRKLLSFENLKQIL